MDIDEKRDYYSPKRFSVEFIGCQAISYFYLWTSISVQLKKANTSYVEQALVQGISYAVMSWLGRWRTGGHFNPAVSCAMAKIKQIPWPAAFLYSVFQIMGGMFGAGIISYQQIEKDRMMIEPLHSGVPIPSMNPAIPAVSIFLIEVIGSGILGFVLNGLMTDKRSSPEAYGVGYGGVAMMHWIGAHPLSGGAINPMLVVGPCLVFVQSFMNTTRFAIAMFAPIIGCIAGAIIYEVLFKTADSVAAAEEGDEMETKRPTVEEEQGLVEMETDKPNPMLVPDSCRTVVGLEDPEPEDAEGDTEDKVGGEGDAGEENTGEVEEKPVVAGEDGDWEKPAEEPTDPPADPPAEE